MIDNSHLIYVGVLSVFLIGAVTIVLFTALALACGFAVTRALWLRKSLILRKSKAAAHCEEDLVH